MQKPFSSIIQVTFACCISLVMLCRAKAQGWSSSSGNTTTTDTVGIGTTTPLSPLHVITTNTSTSILQVRNQSTSAGNSRGLFVAAGTNSSDYVLALRDAADNDLVRVLGNGNFGIGTTSPGDPLSVNGNLGIGANKIYNGAANNSAGIDFATAGLVNISGFSGIVFNSSPAGIGAQTERMRISNSGNVGIGTTSPQGKLHIKAATNENIWLRDAGPTQKAQIISVADDNGTINTLSIDGSNLLLNSQANGTVAVGTSSPNTAYKLDVNGNTNVTGNINLTGSINAKYQDVAEWVPSSEHLSAGTVVVLDSSKSNQVTSSSTSYDTRVAGVVSEQPGIALGEKSDGKVLVATTGRVRVKVDASKAPIHIGDLLVTSDISGMAMKSEPIMIGGRQIHAPGTLIGKALEPLEKGKGEILVLLSLQ